MTGPGRPCSKHTAHVCGIPFTISTDVTTVSSSHGDRHLPVVLLELALAMQGTTPRHVSEAALVFEPSDADRLVEVITEAIHRATRTAAAYSEGMAEITDLTNGETP